MKYSIGVLPFVNVTRDAEMEILADGLTDELITSLSGIEGTRIISRTSSFALKHLTVDMRTAAGQLGVEYLLEGSVRRSGDRVRVNARLVRTADESHRWVRQIERGVGEILDLPWELARSIADELRLELCNVDERPIGAGGHWTEAHRLYLKGVHFLHSRRPGGLRQALECLELAVQLQPDFAEAWSRIADCHLRMANFALSPGRQSVELARTAARRALELEPNKAEPHATLAYLAAMVDYDWAAAETEFGVALQKRPEAAEVRGIYGGILLSQGRFAEAEVELRAVRIIDPLNTIVNLGIGFLQLCRRGYDAAAETLEKVLQADPASPYALYWLAETRLLQRRFDDVPALIADTAMPSFGCGLRVLFLAGRGRVDEAIRLRREIETTIEPAPALQIALACLGTGDIDGTFQWLERAVDAHSLGVHWIMVDPIWDSVRTDARFRVLLRRIHLIDS
ncbi:MAG: tetratricopeptide repeat protein [Bryobacteraceae bacterium]